MRPAGFHQGVEFSGMTYNSLIPETNLRLYTQLQRQWRNFVSFIVNLNILFLFLQIIKWTLNLL
jgi:hypothetical protein